MKKSVLILALMSTLSCFGQDANRFTSREFVEQLIKSLWRKNSTYSEYLAGSMGEITTSGTNPLKARATFTVKTNHNEKLTPGYWIEILYREGIPFAISSNLNTVLVSPIGLRTEIDELFTPGEKYKIADWNKKIRKETRLASESWKQTMAKLQLYPASYSMKNKMGVVVYSSTNSYTTTESVQIAASRDMDVEKTHTYNSSREYYRNYSDKPVVIPGIGRELIAFKAEYEYSDISIVLQPGETTSYTKLVKEYNDEGPVRQYIGQMWDEDVLQAAGEYMPRPSVQAGENTYKVESFDNFVPARFKKGDKITFSATGAVRLGTWVGSSSPAGVEGYENYSINKRFLLGALIGRIGDGEWFLIGPATSITVAKDGILQMCINDNDPSNNSGHYVVSLSVTPAPVGTGADTKPVVSPKPVAAPTAAVNTKPANTSRSGPVNPPPAVKSSSACKELSLTNLENFCKTGMAELQAELETLGYSVINNNKRSNVAGFACYNERPNALMIMERKTLDFTENTYSAKL